MKTTKTILTSKRSFGQGDLDALHMLFGKHPKSQARDPRSVSLVGRILHTRIARAFGPSRVKVSYA